MLCKWHYFILCYGFVIFHCVSVRVCAPNLLLPFICQWTFRVFPCSSIFSSVLVTESNLGQLTMHNKASLLTVGCAEGKYSIYCKVKQGLWAANSQKTQTSLWVNDRVRERVVWYLISSWILFSLVGAEVIGSQHHQPSGSNLCGVSVLTVRVLLTSST